MVRSVTDDEIGLKVLQEAPAEAAQGVDIVAVHGLGAHPDDTWCKNVGTREIPRWVNWFQEESMLPAVATNARIMRYGYQSQWFGKGAVRMSVLRVADQLLRALHRERKECRFRPLIFIAYCVGGLVVLKTLVDAENHKDAWPGIFASTIGVMFFGTPFRGAEGINMIEMLEAARREYMEDEVQIDVLQILQPGNNFVMDLVDHFLKIQRQMNKPQVACFYALKASNVGRIVGKQDRIRFVVSASSACLDLSPSTNKFPLSRNHFDMIKFGKPTEEDFEIVRDVVEGMIKRARDQHMTTTTNSPIAVCEGDDIRIPNRNVLPYKHIKSLGMGSYATVEMVEDIISGHVFAHKLFRKYYGPNIEGIRQQFRNEVTVMRRLSSHLHIITLFAAYSCSREFGIILHPVADSGDLASYLHTIVDSENLPTLEECTILKRALGCLVNGLAFIHKHTIQHKDIKPQNILIHQGLILYTDFGIAFDASQDDNTTTTGQPSGFTRRYCAPEVANCTKRNRKSDIFSLGCVFVEILITLEPQPDFERIGLAPYYELLDDLRSALNNKRMASPLWNKLVPICLNMLEPNLDRRVNAVDLLTELHALESTTANTTLGYFCYNCARRMPEEEEKEGAWGGASSIDVLESRPVEEGRRAGSKRTRTMFESA